jgi:hypothetical protein
MSDNEEAYTDITIRLDYPTDRLGQAPKRSNPIGNYFQALLDDQEVCLHLLLAIVMILLCSSYFARNANTTTAAIAAVGIAGFLYTVFRR